MRNLAILSACLLAACGGAGDGEKTAEAQAATVEAGQWETSFEVTAFRSTDKTTPAVKAAVGDKESGPTCIPAGSEASPPGELFAGPGYTCQTQSSYIRNGRINVSLKCSRSGISGDIMQTVQGSYTGTTFEGTVDTLSYLPGPGDFAMARKFSGRKTGATCAAAEGEPGLEKSGARGG